MKIEYAPHSKYLQLIPENVEDDKFLKELNRKLLSWHSKGYVLHNNGRVEDAKTGITTSLDFRVESVK